MFVLVRVSDNFYVARPGEEHSYVPRLEQACVFPTREAADKERCVESEVIRSVQEILGRECAQ